MLFVQNEAVVLARRILWCSLAVLQHTTIVTRKKVISLLLRITIFGAAGQKKLFFTRSYAAKFGTVSCVTLGNTPAKGISTNSSVALVKKK